jgi:hypothetical protein
MFQQTPPAYPQNDIDTKYDKYDDKYKYGKYNDKYKNDDKIISNKSPSFNDISLSHILSPVHFVSDYDSLVPPSMFKYNFHDYVLPFRSKGEYVIISPLDIFVPSIKFNHDKRFYAFYDNDVCDTPNIRETISKKIYYKFLDKWLYDSHKSKHILKYFKYSDGKVSLIKDLDKKDDYDTNSHEIIDKKVDFIEHNIFRMDDLYVILKQFIAGTRVSWCDLIENSYFIREAIEKTLENKIKKLISSQ